MKRSILILTAAAALAVAPFAGASRGESTAGLRADGLRWQALAAAYAAPQGETPAGLHADGLRWREIAHAYITAPHHSSSTLANVLVAAGALTAASGAFVLTKLRARRVVHPVVPVAES